MISNFKKLMQEAQSSGNKAYAAFCALAIAKYQEELKSSSINNEAFSYYEAATLMV